jgi:hypothetical protein
VASLLVFGVLHLLSHRRRGEEVGAGIGVGANGLVAGGRVRSFGADEDDVEFESCCGASTCRFVLPPKPSTGAWALHALFAVLVSVGAVLYLDADVLVRSPLLGGSGSTGSSASTGAVAGYCAAGWLSVAMALHAVLSKPPAEPAQFRHDSEWGAVSASLTRAWHVCALIGFDLIARAIGAADDETAGPQDYQTVARANTAAHALFAVLPVAWAWGALSSPDAWLSWALEQLHIVLHGGTASASDGRALWTFLIGAVAVQICFATYALSGQPTAMLFVALALGWVTAHNLLPVPREPHLSPSADRTGALSRVVPLGRCWPFAASASTIEQMAALTMVALALALAVVLPLLGLSLDGSSLALARSRLSGPGARGSDSVELIWLAAIAAVAVGGLVLVQVQRPFFLGLCRNRCFERWSNSSCLLWSKSPAVCLMHSPHPIVRLTTAPATALTVRKC